ncbi:MAG: flagellar brake protein [Proteobacteria bacterium]|nr:flagellar brake protein [Pseudomonadota bacterium]
MNLQPVLLADIPIGAALPWQLFDRHGYMLFARGEVIASHQQLEALATDGLLRDVDAPSQNESATEWTEFKGLPPDESFPPAGIMPQIGEKVQLRLLGQDIQAYYYAHLIGYIKGQSILLTIPLMAGQRIDMNEGERVELRMLTGSNIYIFRSEILRVCTSPSHYMHLQYPVKVKTQKLRSGSRTRVRISAQVTDEQGEELTTQIIDLSPVGAQFIVPRQNNLKGTHLRLSFQAAVDELDTLLTLDCLVQHQHPAVPGEEWGAEMLEYGVAFSNVSNQHKLWLKCLVYQHIAEGGLI